MSYEYQAKHLEMIQGVINRMAANSFLIKGWTLTIVTALIALDIKGPKGNVVCGLFPAIVFWCLDAYYLRQERLFRKLHEAIVTDVKDNTTRVPLFDMRTRTVESDVQPVWRVMFSGSMLMFYLVIVFVILGVMVLGVSKSPAH